MRQFRVWVGTAISLVFLLWLFWRVDFAELLHAIGGVEPWWLVVALGVFATSIAARVVRWHTILAGVLPIPMLEAAELLLIGAATNNILPARGGEVVRAALLRRRHGGSMVTALGTIVVERVFDVLALVLILSVTLNFLPSSEVFARAALGVGMLAIAVLAGLVALAVRPSLVRAVIAAVLSVLPAGIRDRVAPLLQRLLDGLTLLGPRAWVVVGLASIATWTFEGIAYLLVGRAFGFDLDPQVYFALCGAANLSVAIPATSGGIGPYEKITTATLVTFTVITESTATAYALVLHMFVLLPVTVVGLVLLWRRNLGLGDLTRAGNVEAGEVTSR